MAAMQAYFDKFLAIRKQFDDSGAPAVLTRFLLTFILVSAYLYLQWESPKEGTVPGVLITGTGIVTGYYLTSDASHLMKSILAVVYTAALAAFLIQFQWVPESVNTQVSTVLGIYFGRRVVQAMSEPAKPVSP